MEINPNNQMRQKIKMQVKKVICKLVFLYFHLEKRQLHFLEIVPMKMKQTKEMMLKKTMEDLKKQFKEGLALCINVKIQSIKWMEAWTLNSLKALILSLLLELKMMKKKPKVTMKIQKMRILLRLQKLLIFLKFKSYL